eukprot:symbB.v1.2.022000.t1/scaffold1932.1/size98745/2
MMRSEARHQRQASVRRHRPAGIRFSPQGGLPFPAELRPNCRPIKSLSIPDIDTYFASYRNFLNMCSFHKSGQESLSVYRSSSLQKKAFFPPAKHTKFEEWLALQVHNDGTVVVHDFRPQQTAFDELLQVRCITGPTVETSKTEQTPQPRQRGFGCGLRRARRA